MPRFAIVLVATLVGILSATPPRAAFDLETSALPSTNLELVVLEAEGCIYCQIFRRDVAPAYEVSPRAREVPLRFVDLNEPNAGKLGLSDPIDLIPTVVLMKDHREVGRITGYVGPEAFFHSVNRLLAQSP